MDLKEQKYVCTLAECGNLTRASEKLFISQPALSIYINNLEKSLGTALFERNGKKFTLTYAGESYVKRAKIMLELGREFREELDDIVREKRGRVRIGVSLRRAPWLVPPVIAEFEKKWPDVEVIIREGNLSDFNEMLKNYGLDLLILNRSDVSPNMDTYSLFMEEFLLVVPQVHPLNEKAEYVPGEKYRKVSPESLNGQVLFLHSSWQSNRKIEDEIIQKHNIVPSRVRVVRGMELTYQMVAEGLGVGFMREGYATHMNYRKPVNYYILDTERHQKELVIASKSGVKLPDYMEDMIRMFQEYGKDYLN